ncbi:MAG: hypothetical protein MZV70_51580 [Desulfobacterales bacterium]|nr:hypothetical protein [Desulfobacterales bacterium]
MLVFDEGQIGQAEVRRRGWRWPGSMLGQARRGLKTAASTTLRLSQASSTGSVTG